MGTTNWIEVSQYDARVCGEPMIRFVAGTSTGDFAVRLSELKGPFACLRVAIRYARGRWPNSPPSIYLPFLSLRLCWFCIELERRAASNEGRFVPTISWWSVYRELSRFRKNPAIRNQCNP